MSNKGKLYYINCCLKEHIDSPCIWVYDPCLNITPPFDIGKVAHGSKKCFVQLRNADKIYISNFDKYLDTIEEFTLFNNAKNNKAVYPIVFISEYYRKVLNIDDISQKIELNKGVNTNLRCLNIQTPSNYLTYIYHLFRSAVINPSIKVRFTAIIAILGLLFTVKMVYSGMTCFATVISLLVQTSAIYLLGKIRYLSLIFVLINMGVIFVNPNLPEIISHFFCK